MKLIAKLLTFLTVIVLLFVGYYIWSSRLTVATNVEIVPANQWQETFDIIAQGVRSGDFQGKAEIGASDDYSFVTLIVAVKNHNLFEANWVQLVPDELESDIVTVLDNTGPFDIGFLGENTLYIRYLSKNASSPRTAELDYYILGRLFTLELNFMQPQTQTDY